MPPGLTNGEVTSVSCDSRRVGSGTVFVGLPGAQVDGGVFWPQALKAGAVLAVIGRAAAEACPPADLDPVLVVTEPVARWAGLLAAEFWQQPSQRLCLIGVTGTDGKTTTSTFLSTALTAAGLRTGLISTAISRVGGNQRAAAAHQTTPEAPALQRALREMVEAGDEAES